MKRAIKAQFGKAPEDMTIAEQMWALKWEVDNDPKYAATKAALSGSGSSESMAETLVNNYERPGNVGRATNQRLDMLRGLGNLADGPATKPAPMTYQLKRLSAAVRQRLSFFIIPAAEEPLSAFGRR